MRLSCQRLHRGCHIPNVNAPFLSLHWPGVQSQIYVFGTICLSDVFAPAHYLYMMAFPPPPPPGSSMIPFWSSFGTEAVVALSFVFFFYACAAQAYHK